MRISSRLRPKRRSDTVVSGSRGRNVDGWFSAAVLWRNQVSPSRKASVTNPTATAVPAGPSFAGRVRPITVRSPPRCAMRSLLAFNGAPHEPQKRFSGGLACLHRGHGVWSVMVPFSSRPIFPLYTSLRLVADVYPEFLLGDRDVTRLSIALPMLSRESSSSVPSPRTSSTSSSSS